MKQLVPFKVDPELLDLIDKLILLSQLGWTRRHYNNRTTFILNAIKVQARELLGELQRDVEIQPLVDKVLEPFDLSLLAEVDPEWTPKGPQSHD
jgi:hypothetical protein